MPVSRTARVLATIVLVASALKVPTVLAGPPREDATAGATREADDDAPKIIADALELVGVRYRRGGDDADSGLDCSGLVVYVFREAGLTLPRTTRDISRKGVRVRKVDLEPGDLVFFNTRRRPYSHVGIYLGDFRFIHAPRPGGVVRIEDLRETYWIQRYDGARRLETPSQADTPDQVEAGLSSGG